MAEWNFGKIAHGADYYPEQWLDRPEILEADLDLMEKAHVNIVTLGVFSWVMLEPEEGEFHLDWLEEIINRLYARGIRVLLATPSGARPAWLSQKYPEVLRVTEARHRNLHGMRLNHCYTSPEYRKKVRCIDSKLAERFANHPAVAGWHISNEYHGECHCPLCQEAFREYLKRKYGTLEKLNAAWWTTFWSKRYTDWNQIESASTRGEKALSALEVEWLRFVTEQTKDFMRMEIETVRPYNPALPVTTNMIGKLIEVDTPRMMDLLDVAALDIYPQWGNGDDAAIADAAAFEHDLTRCLKDRPYLLLETTPSMTNWEAVGQPKRPGMHMLCAMQAVAHGADAFMMFQWRKGRGGFEKFHGAVVSHDGRCDTRVFGDVAAVGERLEGLTEIIGSQTQAKAAVIFDWNNRWAVRASKGPRQGIDPDAEALKHYSALAAKGVDVDVIDSEHSFDGYRLLIAPMLYMVKPGVAQRLERFTAEGGVLLITCFSGIADENDLCFEGAPGPLCGLLGLRSEELDTLYPQQANALLPLNGVLNQAYGCDFWCDLVKLEGAEAKAVYRDDFYAGSPALTVNRFGKGQAWYLGTNVQADCLQSLYDTLLSEAALAPHVKDLPEGVRVHARVRGGVKYLFCLNFHDAPAVLTLPDCVCVETGRALSGAVTLAAREALIVKTA